MLRFINKKMEWSNLHANYINSFLICISFASNIELQVNLIFKINHIGWLFKKKETKSDRSLPIFIAITAAYHSVFRFFSISALFWMLMDFGIFFLMWASQTQDFLGLLAQKIQQLSEMYTCSGFYTHVHYKSWSLTNRTGFRFKCFVFLQ